MTSIIDGIVCEFSSFSITIYNIRMADFLRCVQIVAANFSRHERRECSHTLKSFLHGQLNDKESRKLQNFLLANYHNR